MSIYCHPVAATTNEIPVFFMARTATIETNDLSHLPRESVRRGADFALLLREGMARRGLNKSQLAAAANLVPGTIGIYARDGYDKQLDKIRQPDENTISSIASVLFVDEDDLREAAGYRRRKPTGDSGEIRDAIRTLAGRLDRAATLAAPDPDSLVVKANGLRSLDDAARAAVAGAAEATAKAMMRALGAGDFLAPGEIIIADVRDQLKVSTGKHLHRVRVPTAQGRAKRVRIAPRESAPDAEHRAA